MDSQASKPAEASIQDTHSCYCIVWQYGVSIIVVQLINSNFYTTMSSGQYPECISFHQVFYFGEI